MNQQAFGASMGLRNYRGDRSNSDGGSDEEEKFSLENRYPISNEDLNLPQFDQKNKQAQDDPIQHQIFLNKIKSEQIDKDDDDIIKKYEQHLKNGVTQMALYDQQNPRGMEGGRLE